jgi:hypothetical protein
VVINVRPIDETTTITTTTTTIVINDQAMVVMEIEMPRIMAILAVEYELIKQLSTSSLYLFSFKA